MSSSRARGRAQSAQAASARARLAAEREQQARRRRQMILVIVPIAVVLVAVGALVVVRLVGSDRSNTPTTGGDAVISKVTSVPPAVLDQVGPGTASNPPRRIDAPALTADGKPKVLYVGGEFCPYCAAERWAVVVALSRFGTFTDLGQTSSSSTDVYPDTPTLTFHGAGYQSEEVSFTGVETTDREQQPLDTLSAEDEKTFATYNAPPYVAGQGGSIPFLDIGGRYISAGASYAPEVLQGKTHDEIATALSDPDSDIAKGVDGAANVITAAICSTTGNQPGNVCSSTGVANASKLLG